MMSQLQGSACSSRASDNGSLDCVESQRISASSQLTSQTSYRSDVSNLIIRLSHKEATKNGEAGRQHLRQCNFREQSALANKRIAKCGDVQLS